MSLENDGINRKELFNSMASFLNASGKNVAVKEEIGEDRDDVPYSYDTYFTKFSTLSLVQKFDDGEKEIVSHKTVRSRIRRTDGSGITRSVYELDKFVEEDVAEKILNLVQFYFPKLSDYMDSLDWLQERRESREKAIQKRKLLDK